MSVIGKAFRLARRLRQGPRVVVDETHAANGSEATGRGAPDNPNHHIKREELPRGGGMAGLGRTSAGPGGLTRRAKRQEASLGKLVTLDGTELHVNDGLVATAKERLVEDLLDFLRD